MKTNFKLKYAICMLCIALITVSASYAKSDTKTYADVNSFEYYAKGENTLELSVEALIKRIFMLSGSKNYKNVSREKIADVMYKNNKLADSFVYEKNKIKSEYLSTSARERKKKICTLLDGHKEGIVLYDGKDAVLICDYYTDGEDIKFMCIDPNVKSPSGRFEIEFSQFNADKAKMCFYCDKGITDITPLEQDSENDGGKDTACITFNTLGGSAVRAQTVKTDTLFNLTGSQPQKDGYIFKGWSDSEKKTTVSFIGSDVYKIYADITLYAVYEKAETEIKSKKYNVTFCDGDTVLYTKEINSEKNEYVKFEGDIPQKDGYTFTGWQSGIYSENLLHLSYELITVNGEKSFNAVWKKDGTCTIAYSADKCKDKLYKQVVKKGENAYVTDIIPHRTGFIFKCWQTKSGQTYMPGNAITPQNDTVLYAVWESGNDEILLNTQKSAYSADESVNLNFTDKNYSAQNKYTYKVKNLFTGVYDTVQNTQYVKSLPQGQYSATVESSLNGVTRVSNTVYFSVYAKDDDENIKVYVNGKKLVFDVQPFVDNSLTFVPMRAPLEALGAYIHWNDAEKTVTSVLGKTTLKFTVNKYVYYKNGEQISTAVCPQNKDGRVFLPLRVAAESFGCRVDWEPVTKSVYIYSADDGIEEENAYTVNNAFGGNVWIIKCVDKINGYYEIRSFTDGKYLSAKDFYAQKNTDVVLTQSGGYTAALWKIYDGENGKIIKSAAANLYLDLTDMKLTAEKCEYNLTAET